MKSANHKYLHLYWLSSACHNAARVACLSFSLFDCDSEIHNANVKLEGNECEQDGRRQEFDEKP
jgi:hypothetical protein